MALLLTVTPAVTFTASSRVTAAMLNAAATPMVVIPNGSITGDLLDLDSIINAIGAQVRGTNYLQWGTFQQHKMDPGGAAIRPNVLPAAVKTYVHDGWWVTATGPGLANSAASFVPLTDTTPAGEASRNSLKIAAGELLTKLELGTWLPSGACQVLAHGKVTFSVWIYSRTGAPFVPHLMVNTGPDLDNAQTVSLAADVIGVPCVDSVWIRQSFTFDPQAFLPSWKNGAMLVLTVSDAPPNGGEYMLFADAQIDVGETATDEVLVPPLWSHVPPGAMIPYAGRIAPAGWVRCDGAEYSVNRYPALASALSDGAGGFRYGGGAGTFRVPDMWGRAFVGLEEYYGVSRNRTEISLTPTSIAGDVMTFPPGVTGVLDLGMGVFNPGINPNALVTQITATTVRFSEGVMGAVVGAVRFSKLGPQDAELPGPVFGADPAAGLGTGRRKRRWQVTIEDCFTLGGSSKAITPMGAMFALSDRAAAMRDLCVGMTVRGGATPAGTVIESFRFMSAADTQAAEIETNNILPAMTGQRLTFELEDPEGTPERQLLLKQNTVVQNGCTWAAGAGGTAGNTLLYVGFHVKLRPGMRISGHTVFDSGLIYIKGVSAAPAGGRDYVILSQVLSTPTLGAPGVTLTFHGAPDDPFDPAERTDPDQHPGTLPAATGYWIIKT